MAQPNRPNLTRTGTDALDDHDVRWAHKGNHPSEASGLLQDDPTFEEFHGILQQQREADYQQANADVDMMTSKEETRGVHP